MKEIFLNKIGNRVYSICVPLILIMMSTNCEGWKSMYIINCSSDVAIIKPTPAAYYIQQSINNYKNKYPDQQFKPNDSIIQKYQIEYLQGEFNTESNFKINGDSITIELKPGESIRIAFTMWLFYPGRIREPSLNVDNLTIITKSDTCIARSRKEILRLQNDKRFKYDKHYKDKVGPNTRHKRKILIK